MTAERGAARGAGHIKPRTLAKLLGNFGIRSRTIRLAGESTPKGYLRERFEGEWLRYLPSPSETGVYPPHPPQPAREAGIEALSASLNPPHVAPRPAFVAGAGEGAKPHGSNDVADVADRGPVGEAGAPEDADDELERIRRKFPTLFTDEGTA